MAHGGVLDGELVENVVGDIFKDCLMVEEIVVVRHLIIRLRVLEILDVVAHNRTAVGIAVL